MLCDLAFFILREDGALPLPAPAADALPRGWLLVLLPELHRLALQLLLSLVRAAGRHALSQVRVRVRARARVRVQVRVRVRVRVTLTRSLSLSLPLALTSVRRL